ncbi:MAG: methyltransferase domain-containing protein [Thiobacillus sp.]|nr:methyltransferase domain-containing protein [Thiobacillus sp.]
MAEIEQYRVLYTQKDLPVFQNRMYDLESEARSCPTGDIVLVEDQETGLVYNIAFESARMDYDDHYQNEQACSPLFRSHLENVSSIIQRTMGKTGLVEVGCGKGYFLEMLLENGFDLTGFDPAYEGDNPRILRQYFQPDAGMRADGMILRHVLEHIENPYDFLTKLRDANGGAGKIFIEVPCFDWICQRRAWFDIFYEHVNYFRLSDLQRMFGDVIECGRFFGDQYLYLVADIATLKKPVINESDRVTFPVDMMHGQLGRLDMSGVAQNRAAIWGGASKGVIFSLLLERMGRALMMVVDINPVKQGRYLPVTGVRVSSPKEAMETLPHGSTVYVMNSNYLEEIRVMTSNKYKYIGVDGV